MSVDVKAKAAQLVGDVYLSNVMHSFTMTNTPFIRCKRLTVWERLRLGGALMDLCSCPFCKGLPTVA